MDIGSQNRTIDNTSNLLHYQGSWFLNGTWSAPSRGQSGSLSSSNDPNASVTFTLTDTGPTTTFYYYGMQRSNGGLYEICIDCDPNQPEGWKEIDALNRQDDGNNPPVLLFSTTLSTASVHQITIRNKNDTRAVPRGNSQITVARFELASAVPVSSLIQSTSISQTTSPQTTSSQARTASDTSPAVMRTSTISAHNFNPTITANSTNGSATPTIGSLNTPPTLRKKVPIGRIVGLALGLAVLSLFLVLLAYWCISIRTRRNTCTRVGAATKPAGEEDAPGPLAQTRSAEPLTSPSGSSHRDSTDKSSIISPRHKAGLSSLSWIDVTLYSRYRPSFSTLSIFSQSSSDYTNASPVDSSARREIDGGPLPVMPSEKYEGGVEVLPPAYGQVFGRSQRNIRPTSA